MAVQGGQRKPAQPTPSLEPQEEQFRAMDPLGACERLRNHLSARVDERLWDVRDAIGESARSTRCSGTRWRLTANIRRSVTRCSPLAADRSTRSKRRSPTGSALGSCAAGAGAQGHGRQAREASGPGVLEARGRAGRGQGPSSSKARISGRCT